MLAEQRYERILSLLEKKRSVTVTELKELLDTSESTIRRDILALHNAGKLTKVFGGAVAKNNQVFSIGEPTVAQKMQIYREEKQRIARYAAALIEPDDFVYLDAGTTTECILDYLTDRRVTFVTNAVAHAQRLAADGIPVILLGGQLKTSTEAVVGSQAMQMLMNYHFTKGFFGTNGITEETGFTTPDDSEAAIKKMAMQQCRERYVLADSSKFGVVGPVTFSSFYHATILTEQIVKGYGGMKNIVVVE